MVEFVFIFAFVSLFTKGLQHLRLGRPPSAEHQHVDRGQDRDWREQAVACQCKLDFLKITLMLMLLLMLMLMLMLMLIEKIPVAESLSPALTMARVNFHTESEALMGFSAFNRKHSSREIPIRCKNLAAGAQDLAPVRRWRWLRLLKT